MKMRKRRKQFAWGWYVVRSVRLGYLGEVKLGDYGLCRKIRGTKGYYV